MHGLVRWRAQQEADHDSYWKPYVVWMNLVVRHDALFTEARPYQWIIPHLPSTKALHDNFQIPPRPLLCAVLRVYAEVWKSARRWQRAERLFIKLFHIAKEMGDDDLKRIFRHELGEIQFHRKFQDEESARGSDIKRRTEAAILIEKIYASERLELGENDLMTLSTGTNLVGIYFRQGREAKAAELSAKLLESQTEALGATHPQTLMLRLHACSRGPAKAEIVANVKIQTGVLDLATEQLGKDHPVTISAMRHLASSHGKLERWPEAEELLFKVIGVQTAVLGQAHPDTLADMRKLAALYEARGSTAEAAELREKADALYREYLEPEDPEEEIRRYDLFDAQMGSPSEVKTERQDLTQHEQDDNEDIHRPPSPTFRGRSWQDGDRGTNYSGSSASEMARYTLDEFDDGPIIVYKYRGGIQTTTQKELCAALDKDVTMRVTKKPIPRYSSRMEIKAEDLLLPDERERLGNTPPYANTIASVKLPSYWSRLLLGKFKDLYILSPETERTDDSPYVSDGDSEGSNDESRSVRLRVAAKQIDNARLERDLATARQNANNLDRRVPVWTPLNEAGAVLPGTHGLHELSAPSESVNDSGT